MKDAARSYLIGVDGGGTKTRVRLADSFGQEMACVLGGPSALIHGAANSWREIMPTISLAFAEANVAMPDLSRLYVGIGLAGVHNKQWANQFMELAPAFAKLSVDTDAYTSLLGAHNGAPGAIIAIGTGSVGESVDASGLRRSVGGWGFPCGDEGSGAWIGMRAVTHLQHVADGRIEPTGLTEALKTSCGGSRHQLLLWLGNATQASFASLAPVVIGCASTDSFAKGIVEDAAKEITGMARALDLSGSLPLALCGGVAGVIAQYLPESLTRRLVPAQMDSASGALVLARRMLIGDQR